MRDLNQQKYKPSPFEVFYRELLHHRTELSERGPALSRQVNQVRVFLVVFKLSLSCSRPSHSMHEFGRQTLVSRFEV